MRRSRAAGPAAFAAGIAARYGRAGAPRSSLALLLRRTRSRVEGARHYHRHSVRLGPLYFSRRATSGSGTIPFPTRLVLPRAVIQQRMRALRVHPALARRLDATRPAPSALAPNGIPLVVRGRVVRTEPLPRVLRIAPARVDPVATLPDTPRRTEPAARWLPREAALGATLAPAELERLTSHVLSTLDRRVTAFRERRGKA